MMERPAMNELPRIYADFNNADEDGRLRLNVNGALDAIARLGDPLKAGDRFIYSDGELEVEGSAEPSGTVPRVLDGTDRLDPDSRLHGRLKRLTAARPGRCELGKVRFR